MGSPNPNANRMKADVMKLVTSKHEVSIANSMNELVVTFHGPSDTPYAGGTWKVRVDLPERYPFKSPSIGFANRIYHPNIDEASGTVCLDVINQTWSPMYELTNVFDTFLPQLLAYPNPTDPLNGDAASLYIHKPEEYNERVKDYVRRYASGCAVEESSTSRYGGAISILRRAAASASSSQSSATTQTSSLGIILQGGRTGSSSVENAQEFVRSVANAYLNATSSTATGERRLRSSSTAFSTSAMGEAVTSSSSGTSNSSSVSEVRTRSSTGVDRTPALLSVSRQRHEHHRRRQLQMEPNVTGVALLNDASHTARATFPLMIIPLVPCSSTDDQVVGSTSNTVVDEFMNDTGDCGDDENSRDTASTSCTDVTFESSEMELRFGRGPPPVQIDLVSFTEMYPRDSSPQGAISEVGPIDEDYNHFHTPINYNTTEDSYVSFSSGATTVDTYMEDSDTCSEIFQDTNDAMQVSRHHADQRFEAAPLFDPDELDTSVGFTDESLESQSSGNTSMPVILIGRQRTRRWTYTSEDDQKLLRESSIPSKMAMPCVATNLSEMKMKTPSIIGDNQRRRCVTLPSRSELSDESDMSDFDSR